MIPCNKVAEKDQFIPEFLYIEEYESPPLENREISDDEEETRGVIIIDLLG